MMLATIAALAASRAPLTDLDLSKADQARGVPQVGRSVAGKPLTIGRKGYSAGWGTHANSELIIDLGGRGERFLAEVGVDAAAPPGGTVRFSVSADGELLWQSAVLRRDDAPVSIDVDLSRRKTLVLRADDAGDGDRGDHANWADAVITYRGRRPATVDVLPERRGMINPGKRWLDMDGRPIQAHSGGILKYGGLYYWYGEERSQGYFNKTGVACYSSKDLIRWKNEGIAMPSRAFPAMFRDEGVCERPKVLFNAKTGKFVMWSHLDARSYGVSRAGVAIADEPTGPFTMVRWYQPVGGETFRDMNLLQDDDGSAYVFYSSEENATMYIVRLSEDYLQHEIPMVLGTTWAKAFERGWREAPAPFKHGEKFYIVTSGCTGWTPNEAQAAVADHPLGSWRVVGNPIVGNGARNTFGGQGTFVFQRYGAPAGEFVFMADRWNSDNLADSRYLWLPLTIGPEEKVEIRWADAWRPGQ